MIWKNPDGFYTVWKMGNDPEKSGNFIRFFCYTRKKILDEATNFQVAMVPYYPIFWASVAKFLVRAVVSSNYQSRKKVENYIFSTKLRSWQILTGSVARKIAKLGKITSSRVELVCLPRYFVDKLTSLNKLCGLETLVKTRHSFGAKRSC